ncbi:hypothetical protein BCR32DRAFT_287619, partial [Anaeromyces robustus]
MDNNLNNNKNNTSVNVDFQNIFKNWKTEQNTYKTLLKIYIIKYWIWLIDQETDGINTNLNDQVEDAKFKSEQKTKIIALTKELMTKNFIPAGLMKERFEVEMLEAIGLINSSKQFTKKSARINTSLLYKQTKFNLLREESEGYAKLITEITTNMYTYHPYGLSKEEIEKKDIILNERVHLVLTNIKSLIGYFDLDPNRVLDIIFDIFIANLDLKGRTSNGQILGNKFAYYQDPESPDNASFPLYVVTALLIKNNLVNINDLYPHLAPENDSMDEEYSQYLKEVKKNTEKETEPNPLLSAGSLSDDTVPSDHKKSKDDSSKDKEEKEKKEEKKKIVKTNQKAGLLAALLSIGDLKNSKIILDVSPRLGIMYQEIVHLISRIIHVSIQPLYKKVMKIPDTEESLEPKPYLTIHYELCNPLYEANLVIPRKKGYRVSSVIRYMFFYQQWKNDIPICNTFDDLLNYIPKFLKYVGIQIHQELTVLTKLVRLAKAHIKEKNVSEEYNNMWLSIISTYFLPSVSLLYSNPGFVMELWGLIKQYPYQVRYSLYSNWKNKSYRINQELAIVKISALKEIRRLMRRLSKDNTKQIGRMFGKLVHSNPVIAFDKMLEMIEGYENMTNPLVDGCKYLTHLEFDILSFVLIERLATSFKERIKEDGTSLAQWLSNLATFMGTVYKKYASMELSGILRYIIYQLKCNNVIDLVILKELIQKMSGIEITENLSDSQLDALAGGETLKREASTTRLIHTLTNYNLITPLFISLCQQRSICVYNTNLTHLKLIGNMFDQTNDTMIQYAEFLMANIDKHNYSKYIPSIKELCNNYYIDPETAFYIIRPKLNYLMRKAEQRESSNSIIVNNNTENSNSERVEKTEKLIENSNSMDIDEKPSESMEIDNNNNNNIETLNIWHKGLLTTIEEVSSILPNNVWDGISPQFYVTFWQLSLYDIYIPQSRYQEQIKKEKQIIHNLENDRDENSNTTKRRKERERGLEVIDRLENELNVQSENNKKVLARLKKEKNYWFANCTNIYNIISYLIQYCLYPR